MYKALIIDDEQWVIENLKESVDWEAFDFTVVGTALNGTAGFELIRKHEPDLVFIDIRMPGMNGLECIQKTKNLQLPSKFIVVSGFAEFSYVQKSLNLGASGYCLKPIDETEIAGMLRKIKDGLDAERFKDPSVLLDSIIEGSKESLELVKQALLHAGMGRYGEDGLRAAVCIGTGAEVLWKDYKHLKIPVGRKKQIFVVKDEVSRPLNAFYHRQLPEGCKGIGLSEPIWDLGGLRAAIDRADSAAYRYFIAGDSRTITPAPNGNKDPNHGWVDSFRALAAELEKRDLSRIDRLLDQYAEQAESAAELTIREVFAFYSTVCSLIFSISSAEVFHDSVLAGYDQLADKYSNVRGMIEDMKRLAAHHLGTASAPGDKQGRNDSFAAMLQYIERDYNRNITLQTLSETFYIHPNYISQLFGKKLGKPFTEYLSEIRIAHACALLKSSTCSIQEIGEKVGIHDSFYFSRLFKKVKGVTPSEYRRGAGRD